MRKKVEKHYTLLVYEDEDSVIKFLESQRVASDSIKYLIKQVYEQIGDQDLFEYLENNDLTITQTGKGKKEIHLLNDDLSFWARGDFFKN